MEYYKNMLIEDIQWYKRFIGEEIEDVKITGYEKLEELEKKRKKLQSIYNMITS